MKKATTKKTNSTAQKQCAECGKTLAMSKFKPNARAKDGYNKVCLICTGDQTVTVNSGFLGHQHSESTKQRISAAAKGNKPVNKGKRGLYTHDAETRAKISNAVKAAYLKRKNRPPLQPMTKTTVHTKKTKKSVKVK